MPLQESARNSATVGALLQRWRKARHLSQLELASRAEVSPRHVCFLETGRSKPSRDMLLLLEEAGEPVYNFFSTVTTLGTPQDITLQELRIECFFPADAQTEKHARALGASGQS